MQLSYQDPFYICRATYSERRKLQRAGFRFDQATRRFYTSSIQVASRLREHATDQCRKILNRSLIEVTPFTGRIRYPKGLKPLFFQPGAARFSLSRNRSYLWIDPGLGKTIIAALIMNALLDHDVLYICPPFLVANVRDELEKWYLGSLSRVWLLPDSILDQESTQEVFENFLALALQEKRKVLLIVDEAHRFKNPKAGRALYLLEGYAPKIDRHVWMSGTAMPNRPLELYPVLSRFAQDCIDFMDEFNFGMEYCGGRRNKFGYDFKGATNMKKLAGKVIGTFMYRLKKALLKLPPLSEDILIIGERMSPALIDLDRKLLREHSPEDLMGYLAPNEHVSTYRKELGKLKAKAALPFIRSILEDTEDKVIVVTVHREVMAMMKLGLEKWALSFIDGSVPTHKRVAVAKEWQAGNKRLMLLNDVAGGLGFNLTKCNRVVFVEFGWVDDNNKQVIDRAFRFGQKKNVHVQYCVFKNSIDRKVLEVCLKKRSLGEYI